MKKKIIIAFFALCVLLSATVLYLNRIFLPFTAKKMIISNLQKQIQKEVSLDSLSFSIFRGIVIENLEISDASGPILRVKKAACGFLFLPFLRREIIIPSATLDSCQIFVERYSDKSFNLAELFIKQEKEDSSDDKFLLRLTKLNINDSEIFFKDASVGPVFSKKLENLDLSANFSPPTKVDFSLSSRIASPANTLVNVQGSYEILDQDLSLEANISDLSLEEFSAYYQDLGLSVEKGLISANLKASLKDDDLSLELKGKAEEISLSKDNLKGKVDSKFNADYKINLTEDVPLYSGYLQVDSMEISGFDFVDRVEQIQGPVRFDNTGIYTDKMSLKLLGLSWEGQLKIEDFDDPQAQIRLKSELNLSQILPILKDKFTLANLKDLQGEAELDLGIFTSLPMLAKPRIGGKLQLVRSSVRLDQPDILIKDINGLVEFSDDQIKWQDLDISYLNNQYKISGSLIDFQSPTLELDASSRGLNLKGKMSIKEKRAIISSCAGNYFDSVFSIKGDLDLRQAGKIDAHLITTVDLELADIVKFPFLEQYAKNLERLKLGGKSHGEFEIRGDISDFKTCGVSGTLTGPAISLYNLNGGNFLLDYNQLDGIISLPLLHMVLYGGSLDASAKFNLLSKELPFRADFNIQGVKLEKLKLDTPMKDKELSGTLRAQAKLSGFSSDLGKLSGSGKLFIDEGNLWQINLFQGLGSMLFTTDFTTILLHEGSCDFTVKDKFFYTDNLRLKGRLADLKGVMKIGFDGSLDAGLDVQVSDQAPISGTFRDVTTAIIGQARRFGEIKIEGTLKEPKYRFEASVVDIIRGVKDTFFQN